MKKFKLQKDENGYYKDILYDNQTVLQLNCGTEVNQHFSESILELLKMAEKAFPASVKNEMRISIKEWKKKLPKNIMVNLHG